MQNDNLKFKIELLSDLFKENQRNIILTLLIILIASLSFGLGYLVNREFTHAPIIIEKCSDFIIGNNGIKK